MSNRVLHCLRCTALFRPTNANQRYCSRRCVEISRHERDKARDRSHSAKVVVTTQNMQERGKRTKAHVDCRHYDVCLTKAARALKASVPCEGCTMHRPQDIRASGPMASFETPMMGIDGCGQGNRRKGIR